MDVIASPAVLTYVQAGSQGGAAPAPAAPQTQAGGKAASQAGQLVEVPTARDKYQALVATKRELYSELGRLTGDRTSLADAVRHRAVTGADRDGLNQRITALDARIADIDKQLTAVNQQITNTAAVPGAVPPDTYTPPYTPANIQEEQLILGGVLGGLAIVFMGGPFMIAWALRVVRRGRMIVPKLPEELNQRLSQLERSVESVAIEVERIGEGQRFVTNLLAEQQMPRLGGAVKIAERVERSTPV